ncbi:MAG: choice-of-anchor D domain-containing protein [Myxococcota bacterium]
MTACRLRPSTYASALLFFLPICITTACDDVQPLNRLVVKGAFDPESLDFGQVPVGTSSTLDVTLKNTGTLPFTVKSIEVPPGFQLNGNDDKQSLIGLALAVGDSALLHATFLAAEEGEKSGEISLAAEETKVTLNVHGVGVVLRAPNLSLNPAMLDFGSVELGSEARKDISIENHGNAPGTIDSITLQSTMAAAGMGDEYRIDASLPITVADGASQRVSVVFKPKVEGNRPDRLILGQPNMLPALNLDVNGAGLPARGGLVCMPSSLDFGPVERGSTRDLAVHCQASGGAVRLIAGSFPAGEMMFGLPTPVSTMDLMVGQGVDITVRFTPQGLPGPVSSSLSLDFNGQMGVSTVHIPVTGEVKPPPVTATAISVVLRWNTRLTDVDVHLVRPGGNPFASDGSDCFFGQPSPDWGTAGDTTDNPFLDQDDTDGLGPENINLSATAPGDYKVYVHYWRDSGLGASNATVDIFIGGTMAGTFNHSLRCDDLWLAGTVHWNGMTGTFTPSGTVTSANEGVCF